MNDKRIFVLVRIMTDIGSGLVTSCLQSTHYEKATAHRILTEFVQLNTTEDAPVSEMHTCISGMQQRKGMVAGEQALEDTGMRYFAQYYEASVQADELHDAQRAYTVEVEVIRTYNVSITIENAVDDEDAKSQAVDRVKYGDEEEQLKDVDDEEVTIEDCYLY